jgi:hypothetical protein
MDAGPRGRLVELRHILRQAQDRAGDRSTVGRHTALVLLDGACELAMGLAAAELGLKRPGTFHATFKSLTDDLNDRWVVSGWAGVDRMHGQRNEAQHPSTARAGSAVSVRTPTPHAPPPVGCV